MLVVWRYEVKMDNFFTVEMPSGAEVLHVAQQYHPGPLVLYGDHLVFHLFEVVGKTAMPKQANA